MTSSPRKKILLSFCSYPGSIAFHLYRALKKQFDILTWGPSADEQILQYLNMESLRGQAVDTDIFYDTTDPADALAYYAPSWKPDAFLWIESGVQFGVDLSRLHCPKACYLLNTHISLPDDHRVNSHLQWARHFGVVFLAQLRFLKRFQHSGINAHWLPAACDPDYYADRQRNRIHPVTLLGKCNSPKRQTLLEKLRQRHPVCFEWRLMEDASSLYSESKIALCDVKDRLSRRVFEAMACGAMVLADPAPGSGLEDLFLDGKHLSYYRSDEELMDKATMFLTNNRLLEEIASAGQKEALENHTYSNRALAVEQALFSC
jgi:hypothetical protein